jgi:hypothetical protein
MTISTLMRRTAVIAAAAIAIAGVAAGPALASTSSATAPGHSAGKHDTYVAAPRAGQAAPDASGGGCSNGAQFPWASACISISGGSVLPDAYIDSLPGGCTNIYLSLFDITTQSWVESNWIGCNTGHFGPYPYGTYSGDAYEAVLSYYSNAGLVQIDSPISYD